MSKMYHMYMYHVCSDTMSKMDQIYMCIYSYTVTQCRRRVVYIYIHTYVVQHNVEDVTYISTCTYSLTQYPRWIRYTRICIHTYIVTNCQKMHQFRRIYLCIHVYVSNSIQCNTMSKIYESCVYI